MYANKLAIAIKANGKILREVGDVVSLPFGTEYSIVLKNLGSFGSDFGRAAVQINIDGSPIAEGSTIAIDPGETMELERFIRNGNMTSGNRFRFIERNAAVMAHRGAKLEDGLIRVEWQFEFRQQPVYNPTIAPGWNPNGGSLYHGSTTLPPATLGGGGSGYVSSRGGNLHNAVAQAAVSDVGITVPGSMSNQQFHSVPTMALQAWKHHMVLRLVGIQDGQYVSKTVNTRDKLRCATCGHSSKSSARFCAQCGTALNLI